jgi:hypothetical protein
MIRTPFDFIVWFLIWEMVAYAGQVSRPIFLLLPIFISYYLIVIRNANTTKENGD